MPRVAPSLQLHPSMKVPPKRKGNANAVTGNGLTVAPLNESPSEKEGKYADGGSAQDGTLNTLNESPSEKEGKCGSSGLRCGGPSCSPQ